MLIIINLLGEVLVESALIEQLVPALFPLSGLYEQPPIPTSHFGVQILPI